MSHSAPPLETPVAETPDPSLKTGEAYSQDMRRLVEVLLQSFAMTPKQTKEIRDTVQKLPSYRTIQRWKNHLQERGHLRPFRRSGGKRKGRRLKGMNIIYLAIYRLVYPKGSSAEINAFLYRMNYGNPHFKFFSHSQICRAEQLLGLTRKRGSTTAFKALLPQNIQKRDDFYNLPYPDGVADVRAKDMIDLDECGIFVNTANRSFGKAFIGRRVNEEGPYSKSEKWNLLLAVSGELGTLEAPSRRWRDMWQNEGTTVERMLAFINHILSTLPHGDEGCRYCFVMDNLSSHKDPCIAAAIHSRGHRLAFRAPYYAIDGPIEYIFNTIQHELNIRLPHISEESLVEEIHRAIRSEHEFQRYFRHCGFWR